jgi:Flp pilus assembly protein TadB
MSKKQTRRAAREAFPKAKAPATAPKPTGGKYSSKTAREKAKSQGTRALKPPSWRRAAIQGAILAVLYFVVIQFIWKGSNPPTLWGSLLIAVVGFIAYTCIAYVIDRFNYNRKLRKLKGPAK